MDGKYERLCVEDGNIVMHPSKSFGGNLYTKDEFDNLVLRSIHAYPEPTTGWYPYADGRRCRYVGMELQIIDNEAPIYKDLQPNKVTGRFTVIPAKRIRNRRGLELLGSDCHGDHIKVILNGTTILDVNIREAAKTARWITKITRDCSIKDISVFGHGRKQNSEIFE